MFPYKGSGALGYLVFKQILCTETNIMILTIVKIGSKSSETPNGCKYPLILDTVPRRAS